jgi:hypothetical protein
MVYGNAKVAASAWNLGRGGQLRELTKTFSAVNDFHTIVKKPDPRSLDTALAIGKRSTSLAQEWITGHDQRHMQRLSFAVKSVSLGRTGWKVSRGETLNGFKATYRANISTGNYHTQAIQTINYRSPLQSTITTHRTTFYRQMR